MIRKLLHNFMGVTAQPPIEAPPPPSPSVGAMDILTQAYGHSRSVDEKMCVDGVGDPIPWYTYPAIEFLAHLDLSAKHVFEYGLGNSSYFLSRNCATVTSVDIDWDWYQKIAAHKRPNMDIRFAADRRSYVSSIQTPDNRQYDIIVVDGSYRLECCHAAIQRFAPGGLIILDNSDWFQESAAFLASQDLLQVDFHGFGPINNYTWTTSFFFSRSFKTSYKALNPGYSLGSIKHDIKETASNGSFV